MARLPVVLETDGCPVLLEPERSSISSMSLPRQSFSSIMFFRVTFPSYRFRYYWEGAKFSV